MALYDRDYNNTVNTMGYAHEVETASVDFMKRTYQLLAASMIAGSLVGGGMVDYGLKAVQGYGRY